MILLENALALNLRRMREGKISFTDTLSVFLFSKLLLPSVYLFV